MIEFNLNGGRFTVSSAAYFIEQAVLAGNAKSSLRFSVGRAQFRMIALGLYSVADLNTCRYETEHGFPELFMFCGIPVVLDVALPEDQIRLVRVSEDYVIGVVTSAAIPTVGYHNKP